ncbi:MAG: hypothetical protein J6D53_01795 [Blautia sp.]|nr:hypothetical protein [Blautia sp.]
MNITVYLGSNEGKTPGLKSAVRELETWIGSAGHTLVYGGSKRGLMGEPAESVLLAGGEVIGIAKTELILALVWKSNKRAGIYY